VKVSFQDYDDDKFTRVTEIYIPMDEDYVQNMRYVGKYIFASES
jgi:hypothetical protein